MTLITLLSISFLFSFLLTPLMRSLALKFRVLDYPNRVRKIHKGPTPLLGGVAIVIAFSASLFIFRIVGRDVMGIILGGIIIAVAGVVDDIKKISATKRLICQLVASLVVIMTGTVFNFLPNNIWGTTGEWILTMIWILGITNGLNYLDGLDGLSGGITVVCSLSLFVAAWLTNQFLVQFICVALLGATIGFLPYNLRKNKKIFLGSCSTFLGFILATVAILGSWGEADVIDLIVPVLILGIPIFDMIFTTISRYYSGKISTITEWMEYAARDHFHHRLLNLGLNPFSTVIFILAVNVTLSIGAITLLRARLSSAFLLLFQGFIIFILISVLMIMGKKPRRWNL